MAVQGASSSSLSSFAYTSSLSSFTYRWKYDVFLSFRGEDTRKNFTAHLYTALIHQGINTYIDDDKLQRGEEISQALSEAIETSRASVVVLSKNYASSRWCLEELAMIIDCRKTKQQKVLPVFYNIDPTEVRHRSKSFGEAWAKLKNSIKDETKVQRWKSALTEVAELAGFTLGDRNESEFIQEVVLKVSKVVKCKYLNGVSKHLVGMQSRVQDIHNMLASVKVKDTPFIIGIFGFGGVGKTTLAKVIYNKFIDQFEYGCFLANVRETSEQEKGLIRLQETLLREILRDSSLDVIETLMQEKGLNRLRKTILLEKIRDSSLKVGNVEDGNRLIKDMLWGKKVLLLLDDVDQMFQVENLLGDCDWLGLGSLIIITTRDQHLLTCNNVHIQYKMKELDHNESLRLFCWNAFKKEEPPNQAFAELIEKFLRYAGGLPLALEVLGSYLYKREEIIFWKDALQKFKRIPSNNIQDKLRISYDGLEENEKNMFLDIACFFAGERKEYVTNILDGCGFFPHANMPILRERCLITIDEYDRINMHDLLKVMGKEIVRKESDKGPGKRTRLWFHEDVRYVLEQNKGTNNIEGILIDLPKEDLIHLSPGAFEKMQLLRVLINRNALFSEPPNYFSNELRLLDFKNYHGSSFPTNFTGKKLIHLRMAKCKIKKLGNDFQHFENLEFLFFSECEFLTRIPDTSGLPHLKELDISLCNGLVEVDQSIGSHKKLILLSIRYCSKLNSFPSSLNLRSLKELIVEWCESLVSFPEIGLEMKCLQSIKWSVTGIKELPSSIGNLNELDLGGNKNLAHIPSSILQLEHLRHLNLDGYTEIIMYPKLTDLSHTGLHPSQLDSSMFTNCFSTLTMLNLSESTFVILPRWMDRFVQLRKLLLKYCKQLKKIEKLPPNIEEVDATGCMSLESFLEVSKRFEFNTSNLSELHSINLSGCSKMLVNVGSHVAATLRAKILGWKHTSSGLLFPGNKIPNWFYHHKETSNSCSTDIFIDVELLNHSVIKGILTCAVVETSTAHFANISIAVNYDGSCLGTTTRLIRLVGSDHVWLAFHDLEPFSLAKGSLQLHFHSYPLSGSLLLKRCGVHLVRMDEANAKWKRDDDDDCNLESNCYPQQKRHYSNDNDDDEHYYSTEEAFFNGDED